MYDFKWKENGKIKCMIVCGTRPEIIRLAATMKRCREYFDTCIVYTNQNWDKNLSTIFWEDFDLGGPDILLHVVGKHLGETCGNILAQTYEVMEEKKLLSAAKIYEYLAETGNDEREKLRREFYTDNHKFWPEEEKPSPMPNPAREMWDKISRQSRMQEEKRGDEPEEGEQSLLRRLTADKSRRSYRDFLRKFAVLREEMQCDPDTFDLNFYTYGLSLYGNMPLIEPVETREVMRIQEFVVVLDTSYSTDGELIKGFLRETFTLLTEKDSFFHKCHIRILQCDDAVREDTKITDISELDAYLEKFTVIGGGGTDFRPAFSYVAGLREQGELRGLRGLLYFTDGKGTYPAKRPEYDVAFIYLDEYEKSKVPPWAMRFEIGGNR